MQKKDFNVKNFLEIFLQGVVFVKRAKNQIGSSRLKKLKITKQVELVPGNGVGVGKPFDFKISLKGERGTGVYVNQSPSMDYYPNQIEDEYFVPKSGRSQGDHILAHSTHIEAMRRFFKGDKNSRITLLQLDSAIDKVLHCNMIRWLNANYRFYKSWNRCAPSDHLRSKIQECVDYCESLVEVYSEYRYECKHLKSGVIFTKKEGDGTYSSSIQVHLEEKFNHERELMRLGEEYLNTYFKAYEILALGIARKVGSYNQLASLKEAAERKQGNSELLRLRPENILFSGVLPDEIEQIKAAFGRKNCYNFMDVLNLVSKKVAEDDCVAANDLCEILRKVIDAEAFGVLFFKQTAPSERFLVVSHFILQVWLLFEALGWIEMPMTYFFDTYYKQNISHAFHQGPFHGFIYLLIEVLSLSNYNNAYQRQELKQAIEKGIDFLVYKGEFEVISN